MLPFINFVGLKLPMYGICMAAGIIICATLAALYVIKHGLDLPRCTITLFLSLITGLAGAKLLSIITVFPLRRIAKLLFSDPARLFTDSGLVFYGGLAAIPFAYLVARLLRFDLASCENLFASLIPLGHAFGRLGCFFAGCCYGCKTDLFGVTFTHPESFAPTGIALFPVQLAEALFEMILFALLFAFVRRGAKKRLCLPIYLCAYPIWRFFAEFFRGDEVRGMYFSLSTSQWISIVIFFAGAILLFLRLKNTNQIDIPNF